MYDNILVPLDGSENSERSLVHAEELAKAFGATLHLVQVVSTSDELEIIQGGEESFVTTEQFSKLVDEIINSRLEQSETYLGRSRPGWRPMESAWWRRCWKGRRRTRLCSMPRVRIST